MALCWDYRQVFHAMILVRSGQPPESGKKGEWQMHVLQSVICNLSGWRGRGEAPRYLDKLSTRFQDPPWQRRMANETGCEVLENCLRHCLIEFGAAWRLGGKRQWLTGHWVLC